MLGHTSAIASLIFHPMRVPKYIKSEKVCAGIPARSRVGFSSANWKEGNRAESVGMLISATGFIARFRLVYFGSAFMYQLFLHKCHLRSFFRSQQPLSRLYSPRRS